MKGEEKEMKKKGTMHLVKGLFIVIIAILLMCFIWRIFNPRYEYGSFSYTLMPRPIMQGIKSDTNNFSLENVMLELYYGVHNLDYDDFKGVYRHFPGETVFFAIYVCDGSEETSIACPMDFEDYKNIENHIFLKELSYEDAFTEEYGYTMDYFGIDYNHHETITIPSDIFTEDSGKFVIKICAFNPSEENETAVTSTSVSTLKLNYEKVDEDTVRIIFDY